MKNRSLVVVALSALFVSLLLRLIWPNQEFLAGLSVALQLSGIVILGIYIVEYFRNRARARS
ncbi:hypothetical protein ASF17_15090 [Frigoribacterium sp. Leaf263]|uniref:hypothetical protein n=1 Tax=Frigoribacterium sp. Leaf263 TaxID=1736313 RepID=UPI0006F8565D|nr:hypothetical protein [Frigoribacterium sp. Leaf263]KQO79501.1 hypothetical protein ASF17_15090 [Frigoribacterium sp. Leaf263]